MKECIGDYYMWYFRYSEYEYTDKSIELNEHTDEDANKQDIKRLNLISNSHNQAGADQPIAESSVKRTANTSRSRDRKNLIFFKNF